MKHEFKGYTLELIDEPLQSHVVAWEQASRSLKSQDAKPGLNRMMQSLQAVNVTDGKDPMKIVGVFIEVSEILGEVIKVLDDNDSLTLSANRSVIVKAGIKSGWVKSIKRHIPEAKSLLHPNGKTEDIPLTFEVIDNMKPWLVTWIAERIWDLYFQVTNVPNA